jgi:hypothetical protein
MKPSIKCGLITCFYSAVIGALTGLNIISVPLWSILPFGLIATAIHMGMVEWIEQEPTE